MPFFGNDRDIEGKNGYHVVRFHRSNESIPAAGDSFDVPWVLGRIAQRTSQLIHGCVQAVLEIHESRLAPDFLTQSLTCKHLARMRK
jgi:hypothetical protein